MILGRYRKARLAVPTLLVFGKDDFAIDRRCSPAREAGRRPQVELVEDCGHFIADERPDLVEARALEFLA